MNLRRLLVAACAVFVMQGISAQVKDELLLKRAAQGKEGINPDEIVSLKNDILLAQALQSISEVSKKLVGKPIVFDPQYFKDRKIGVDIVQMPWRNALEVILRSNGLWYQEAQDYFQLVTPSGTIAAPTQGTQQPTGVTQPVMQQPLTSGFIPLDSTEAIARSREVTISAVFLEVNTSKLNESGVSFSIFRGRDLNLGIEFIGADRVSGNIFGVTATPTQGKLVVDVAGALAFFESSGIGEILARPQVTVRSGSKGRVQVGEDFSVKIRTLAGDVTEQFYSTGTILEVTPKVYNFQGMDFIDIQLIVERSSLTDPTTSRINRTKAESKLLLFNGEENYVAGLFLNEETVSREGIPILKDLPWWVFGLRYIFGYDKASVNKKELIVMLRAELVPMLEERITQKAKNIMEEKLKEGRTDMKKRSQMEKN